MAFKQAARADIVVVGPCGSGKSTLVRTLNARGYAARAVAQEHSGIPDLWRHGGQPAALIMLEATPATITARRQAEFPRWLHAKQIRRLAAARAAADLMIATDRASPAEVATTVIAFLVERGIISRQPVDTFPDRPLQSPS